MKTINQLNAIIKTSELWEMYRILYNIEFNWLRPENYPEIYDRWLRYHKFKSEGGRIFTDRRKSFLWSEIYRSMPYSKDYTIKMVNGEDIRLRLKATVNGIQLTYNYYVRSQTQREVTGAINVRSRETFETFNFERFYTRHIEPKIFYPKGKFRQIQLNNLCSKEDVKTKYKIFIEKFVKGKIFGEVNENAQDAKKINWLESELLKLNIDSTYNFCTSKELYSIYVANKGKKREKITYIERPNIYRFLEEFDDDDEMMTAAEEYLCQENVIFV